MPKRCSYLCRGALLLGGLAAGAPAAPPNILVIVADDLGYADMGCGTEPAPDVQRFGTPAIDALAQRGIFFTEAYATSPICSPSRAGLLTGRYQQRWGNYWYNEGGLPADEETYAEVLQRAGYDTKKIGKTHLGGGDAEHPLDHGFDEFFGFIHHSWDYVRLSREDRQAYLDRAGDSTIGLVNVGPLLEGRDREVSYDGAYTTEVFTDEAIEFVRRDREGRPFLLQLEYNAVHMPTYIVEQRWATRVGLAAEPWDREAEIWSFPYWDPAQMSWKEWHQRWGYLGEIDPDGRRRYLSHLLAMDAGIGELIAALEETGQLEETIVLFTSDNGGTINTYSCNAPLSGWKFSFAEGGIRVPMILAAPFVPESMRLEGVVSQMDVFPTLLEAAGFPVPGDLDGRSLLGKIAGQSNEDTHDHLCWANNRGAEAVRQGRWKLVRGTGWQSRAFTLDDDGKAHRAPKEYAYPGGIALYDLEADISESRNLAEEYPDVVERLGKLLDAWKAEMDGE